MNKKVKIIFQRIFLSVFNYIIHYYHIFELFNIWIIIDIFQNFHGNVDLMTILSFGNEVIFCKSEGILAK